MNYFPNLTELTYHLKILHKVEFFLDLKKHLENSSFFSSSQN
jgi:hypothetical protein